MVSASSSNAVGSEALQERIDWWLEESGDELVPASHLPMSDSSKLIGSTFVIEAEDLGIPPPLISFALLLLMSPEDWEKAKQRQKLPKPRLSEEDGPTVLDVISQGLQQRLNQFPSTVEVRAPGL